MLKVTQPPRFRVLPMPLGRARLTPGLCCQLAKLLRVSRIGCAITFTADTVWETANVHWTGNLSPGIHTINLVVDGSTAIWGCGAPWGSMDVIVLR